jgi:DNA-binding transcriptional MerR regulator
MINEIEVRTEIENCIQLGIPIQTIKENLEEKGIDTSELFNEFEVEDEKIAHIKNQISKKRSLAWFFLIIGLFTGFIFLFGNLVSFLMYSLVFLSMAFYQFDKAKAWQTQLFELSE